ncbi:MAG: zf-HC2 domain-containing protein [Actinobacteria bacterium]|nr:MAG: zf-HC2 domain-containing protein [Actinomycetota bacterium]
MAHAPTAAVTAKGIRDGDRAALGALVARRGAAVLAYCDRVAAPGRALEAAGEAFARFRREVVAAAEPRALDPEALLLSGTRRAAAACAPRPAAPRGTLARRRAATCALVAELLVARAEGELTAADRMRLARHLERCEDCRAAATRFTEGERAYHDAPDLPPPDPAAGGLLAALRTAAPNADERHAPPRPQPAGAAINGNGRALGAGATEAGGTRPAGAEAPGRRPGEPATAAGRSGAPPVAAPPHPAGRSGAPPTAEPPATDDARRPPTGDDHPGEPATASPPGEPHGAPALSWDPAELAAAGAAGGRDRPWPVVATRILVPSLVLVAAVVAALAVAGVFEGGEGRGPGGSIETEAVLPPATVHVPRRALTTPLPAGKPGQPSRAHKRSAAAPPAPSSAITPAPPTSSPSATPTPPAAPPPRTGAARQKTHLDARARSNSESAAPPFDGGAPAADEPGGFQPATTPSQ